MKSGSRHQGRVAGVRSVSRPSSGQNAMGETRRKETSGRPLVRAVYADTISACRPTRRRGASTSRLDLTDIFVNYAKLDGMNDGRKADSRLPICVNMGGARHFPIKNCRHLIFEMTAVLLKKSVFNTKRYVWI
jgi:hypothetical protein